MTLPALRDGTPVERYDLNGREVFVKREDLCFAVPISKARGAFAHIAARPERRIACVDTWRSWNGLVTAAVCRALGKEALLYGPVYKSGRRNALHARAAAEFGAAVAIVPAGRQAVMRARVQKDLLPGTHLLPSAFRLPETVEAVAAEYNRTVAAFGEPSAVVVPTGTGTHLAGIARVAAATTRVVAVLGYSRSRAGLPARCEVVDMGYGYDDAEACDLPFPASPYYEAKAWRWLALRGLATLPGRVLFWNVGS